MTAPEPTDLGPVAGVAVIVLCWAVLGGIAGVAVGLIVGNRTLALGSLLVLAVIAAVWGVIMRESQRKDERALRAILDETYSRGGTRKPPVSICLCGAPALSPEGVPHEHVIPDGTSWADLLAATLDQARENAAGGEVA